MKWKLFLIAALSFLFFLPFNAQALSFKDALGQATITGGKAGVKIGGGVSDYVTVIISAALSITGIIFFLLMVYGGYKWMIAKGNEQEAEKAKDIITMATIGFVVVLLAYVLANFIVTKLTAPPV